MKEKGLVFDVQRYSTNDGAGIRTCIFLKGCPLRCNWCHNPESQSFRMELAWYAQNCIGCGACVKVCPQGCHKLEHGIHVFERHKCIACGSCAEVCYAEALCKVGEWKSCEEVMTLVRKDMPFYGENGGITLTGGEPMAQFGFAYALAKAVKAEHISFMIETSGYGKTEDFVRIAPLCDCFLFDCKASESRHEEVTGVRDDLILKNLEAVYNTQANILLRCPIVPGGNLDRPFLEKIAMLARRFPNIRGVQLMPYHRIGLSKAERLGKTHQEEYEVPGEDVLQEMKEWLRDIQGITVVEN